MQPPTVVSFSVDYGWLGAYSISIPIELITFTLFLGTVLLIVYWWYQYKLRAINYPEIRRILDKLEEDENAKSKSR
jgi:hypothetical protein